MKKFLSLIMASVLVSTPCLSQTVTTPNFFGSYPAASSLQTNLSANMSIIDSTITVVKFDVSTFDTQGTYSATTGRYTPNKSGKYLLCTDLIAAATTNVSYMNVSISKNGLNGGAGVQQAVWRVPGVTTLTTSGSGGGCVNVIANGTTDTFEVDAQVVAIGGSDVIVGSSVAGGNGFSFFTATYIGG